MNISKIRLASQQLIDTKQATPSSVVSFMGAMQAQDYNMAKWAIGIRLPESTDKIVEAAFNRGDFLRTHVLRPTWHFVSPENIRWMLQLTGARIKSSTKLRDLDLGITEALYVQCHNIIQKALEEAHHLTREELANVIEKQGIMVNSSRMVHFMMRAELEGIVCSGPIKGKKHTYALLTERVPQTHVLHKEEALAKLAEIYFMSHCPATLQDFTWWSGLSATEARQGLEMIKNKLIFEIIEKQTFWMSNDFCDFSLKNDCIHLLPAFDEYIISYRDRKPSLHSEHHSKAISSNGIFRPVIIKNGQAIGIWKKSQTKNKIATDFFEHPTEATMKKMAKAENNLKFFWKE